MEDSASLTAMILEGTFVDVLGRFFTHQPRMHKSHGQWTPSSPVKPRPKLNHVLLPLPSKRRKVWVRSLS